MKMIIDRRISEAMDFSMRAYCGLSNMLDYVDPGGDILYAAQLAYHDLRDVFLYIKSYAAGRFGYSSAKEKLDAFNAKWCGHHADPHDLSDDLYSAKKSIRYLADSLDQKDRDIEMALKYIISATENFDRDFEVAFALYRTSVNHHLSV